jgi:hypothetical protein
MYEHRSKPLLPIRHFVRRLASHSVAALVVVGVSLAGGTLGYHRLGRLPWIDAFLNASMLLGGMGPVGELTGDSGKIFASLFALYSGFMLIAVTTLILAPVLHRVLHRLHLEEAEVDESAEG